MSTVVAVVLNRPTGTLNFRDAGGAPAGTGRRVRRGLLFRSDTPQFLTPADVDLLVGRLGLRTVVDLRRVEEAEREGWGLLAGTSVVRAAFPVVSRRAQLEQELEQVTEQELERATDVPLVTRWEPVVEHYLGYLAVSGDAVAGAVRRLATPGALPALVHCAAGKDRTGVVVAFALSVAGVADEDVAAEYAAEPDGVARTVERLRGLPGYAAMIDNLPAEAHLTPAHYLEHFLAQVRARFGGPRAWLVTAGGVPEAELDRLAELLTEPTTDEGPPWKA